MSTQLPRFFNWRPDPQAEATDAFLQIREGRNYANPPWALIPRVLSQVRTQQADLILVAPLWNSQAWYPFLLSVLWEYPCRIATWESTILQVQTLPPPIRGQEVQLAAWPISGNRAKPEAFQKSLQNFYWHHGVQNPKPAATHSFTSGSAGIISGIEIPFMDL